MTHLDNQNWNDYTYKILEDNTIAILHYCENGTESVINIPGMIDNHVVSVLGDHCFEKSLFSHCTISEIIVPEGVKKIGSRAFHFQRKMKAIHLPSTLESIGDSAFSCCSSLEGINIPNGVKHIATSAFENCSSIKKVHLPSAVESIGDSAFKNCSRLEEVIISDNTNVGRYAFEGCVALKETKFIDMLEMSGVFVQKDKHFKIFTYSKHKHSDLSNDTLDVWDWFWVVEYESNTLAIGNCSYSDHGPGILIINYNYNCVFSQKYRNVYERWGEILTPGGTIQKAIIEMQSNAMVIRIEVFDNQYKDTYSPRDAWEAKYFKDDKPNHLYYDEIIIILPQTGECHVTQNKKHESW